MRGCRKGASRVHVLLGTRIPWGRLYMCWPDLGGVQLKGEPVQELRPGDTGWIEAGEVHRYGAEVNYTMVHLAMQEADEHRLDVVWLEHVKGCRVSWAAKVTLEDVTR